MSVDKQELRRLAGEASQGKWQHATEQGQIGSVECSGAVMVQVQQMKRGDNAQRNANAAFIAAANPAAILSLLDELEQYRKYALRYRWLREQEAEEGIAVLNVTGWERAATCWALTYPDAELLDAAIDAAMAKEQSQ